MAWDEGQFRRGKFAIDHMKIGAANAAGLHANQQFPKSRDRNAGSRFEPQRLMRLM
jgi:hypothetical protein